MLLIKNVYLYDPASGTEGKTDILTGGGRFVKIRPGISANEARGIAGRAADSPAGESSPADTEDLQILDAEGLCAAPGFVDTHAHFRDPGFTYKEDLHTGALSAAKGGYTSIILMANVKPAVDCVPVLSDILARGQKEKIHLYSCANVTKGMQGRGRRFRGARSRRRRRLYG